MRPQQLLQLSLNRRAQDTELQQELAHWRATDAGRHGSHRLPPSPAAALPFLTPMLWQLPRADAAGQGGVDRYLP